jgi:predicted regulator of Ras-like GTPase activity (Roadblock/LC7/MglB family)
MSLTEALDRWSSRAAIRGAAVISEDGILIHDAVAALALTLFRHAQQLGTAAGAGELGSVVIELTAGPAIVASIDERHTLVVLAYPERDLGPLLFDIRRDKPALSQAV